MDYIQIFLHKDRKNIEKVVVAWGYYKQLHKDVEKCANDAKTAYGCKE
jgi:predicted unusual protein kinase regulating ubiquinone biosynthesis (AarF/ABC1/UbiB family)